MTASLAPPPEATPRRRSLPLGRWLAAMGAILFSLPIASFAWRYRPLNEAERQVLGTWEDAEDAMQANNRLTLTRDRRYVFTLGIGSQCGHTRTGHWSAAGDRLTLAEDSTLQDYRNALELAWAGDGWELGPSPETFRVRVLPHDRRTFRRFHSDTVWHRAEAETGGDVMCRDSAAD